MRKLYSLLFFLVSLGAFSQEVLTGLQFNPRVANRSLQGRKTQHQPYIDDTLPVALPFFDDFSANGVFPSSLRWIDHYAYENNDFPIFPPNIGVMTLDALNDSGKTYPLAVPGPQTFIADHLTSRYIRLDSVFSPVPRALHPSDSVYLSFYYQPQGRGLAPESTDSLALRFLLKPAYDSITATDTTAVPDRWRQVWAVKGMALDTFYLLNNVYFKQVLIPITDSVFFTKKFRFQFFNFVSMASSQQPSWQSNCDEWNLDNVYLNAGRTENDTIRRELRFIENAPSLLKNYQAMPYTQYCNDPTNEIGDSLHILMSNRDTVARKASYKYVVNGLTGTFNKTYDGGQDSIRPFYTNGFVTYIPFAHPPIPFLIPISGADSATFLVRHYLKDLTPGSTLGDTLQRYQEFTNYYAYDDGTPEVGYGINGNQAQMACQFKLNKSPDTLRGVYIFFNRTLQSTATTDVFFYLTVWNDNNGKPGDTIYSRIAKVTYSDSLNQFTGYRLQVPLPITGTFYVGTIQTSSDNMNIGFDRNDNSQDKLFYNAIGTWLSSSYSGSLMLRPIIGKPITLGIQETNNDTSTATLFPNPCSTGTTRIHIQGPADNKGSTEDLNVTVYNLVGSPVMDVPCNGNLDVSSLAAGMYILGIRNNQTRQVYSAKLVITR